MMRNKPMLAYPVSAKPIDYSKPVFIQPKLDGVRCLIQYENRPRKKIECLSGRLTENVVVAYSRTGKVWKNIDHILEELAFFFQKYPNVVLDGELYIMVLMIILRKLYLWSEKQNQLTRIAENHVLMYNFIVMIL